MDLNGIGLAPKSSKDMILRRSFRAKSEGKRATRNGKISRAKRTDGPCQCFPLFQSCGFPSNFLNTDKFLKTWQKDLCAFPITFDVKLCPIAIRFSYSPRPSWLIVKLQAPKKLGRLFSHHLSGKNCKTLVGDLSPPKKMLGKVNLPPTVTWLVNDGILISWFMKYSRNITG